MRARLSRQADRELASLFRWGAEQFGLETANDYYSGLLQVFGLLADNPRISQEVRDGVRAHPYRSHIIIYREGSEHLEILSIRHERSNWRKHV